MLGCCGMSEHESEESVPSERDAGEDWANGFPIKKLMAMYLGGLEVK